MRWNSLITALTGLLAGAIALLLIPQSALFHGPSHASETVNSGARYACPMLCTFAPAPGPCPVCGMRMTEVKAGSLNVEQARRIGLETVKVRMGHARATVRAYGTADYDHRFTRVITPRVSGRIVARFESTFGCCQMVSEGDPIIEIYSPEVIAAQAELSAAMKLGDATLIAAVRSRFERWHLLPVAEAILAGAPPRETVIITAPIAGQVLLADEAMVNLTLEAGREIQPDTELLRLVDPDRLVVVLHVPETRAHWVREGQHALIGTDDRGELPQIHAIVGRAAAELNASLRSREIRLYLTGSRHLLMPGSLVQARIETKLDENLAPADPEDHSSWALFPLVPKEAVLSTGVRHIVWRVAERARDGSVKFEPVVLALGPRLESADGRDEYVVRSGLKEGDELAAQGAFLIDAQAQLAGNRSLLNP